MAGWVRLFGMTGKLKRQDYPDCMPMGRKAL